MTRSLKMPALPKGFAEVRSNLVGFFARKPGNSVFGLLRGSFEAKGKFGPKRIYRIEITDGTTEVETKKGGEEAVIGQVIGLDETGWTKKLSDFSVGQALFVRYIGRDGDDEKAQHVFQIAVPVE